MKMKYKKFNFLNGLLFRKIYVKEIGKYFKVLLKI